MKIYGIKTCDSVRKALKYLDSKGIEYEFIDFKKSPVDCDTIDRWLNNGVEIDTLFNKRGTKYRTLKLKELNLDRDGMREWLCRENLLIKRPVLELDDGKVFVGFKEDIYNDIFKD